MYIDTHCHIHSKEFFSDQEADSVYKESIESQIEHMVLIGTDLKDSQTAINFAKNHQYTSVAVGIHPHEAAKMSKGEISKNVEKLTKLVNEESVVAIGECGLDFYYNDRSENYAKQVYLLEAQLQIASNYSLPVSFHVREAFSDFWPIFNNFTGITGVLHSFTDNQKNMDQALQHKLMIGINGIATFTSHDWQRQLFKSAPQQNIVLETDSPFLTPHPLRGKINKPKNVTYITSYLAELREEDANTIAQYTTANARRLFRI